jgi:3-oxoacyl-[acyl-carrier protein] reductase
LDQVSLKDKVAVITGASRGLGRAMAIEFGRQGAFTIVNYVKDEKSARQTLDMVREAGGDGEIAMADVRKPEQVQAMFQGIFKTHKKVDVLVNNAGITRDEYFLMMRPQSWLELMDVHLNGIFYCSKAVVRNMCAAKKGVILNIGSGSALVAMPGQVNYSASKAGLLGFSRSLAREVADKGVRVLHVAPGFFESDMTATLDPKFIQQTFDVTPLGRWGLGTELASVVTFLASDDCSFFTGHSVVIDGGRGAVEMEFGS